MGKLIACLAILLTGCATSPRVETVNVAVPVVHVITKPERPTLAVGALTESSTPGQVITSYVATIQQLLGYAQQLENLIDTNNAQAK